MVEQSACQSLGQPTSDWKLPATVMLAGWVAALALIGALLICRRDVSD